MVYWYGKFFLEGSNHFKTCSKLHHKTGDGIEKLIDQIFMIIQVKILNFVMVIPNLKLSNSSLSEADHIVKQMFGNGTNRKGFELC